MDTLVIYHGGCADGFCAAWCAWRLFGNKAEYMPANHGESPPDVSHKDIYLLDFSYKADVLRRIAACNKHVTVIDHHKTAEAELCGLSDKLGDFSATFDMTKSGGRLAWEYFHPGKSIPWLVRYTEDRDLWRWQLPRSREISAWLASVPWTFEMADYLYPEPAGSLEDSYAEQGAAILRYQKQKLNDALKHAREIDLDGHKVLCVNATHLTSEIAGELAKDRPFGVCWFERSDGKKIWSLRSTPDGIDVSEIARRHGGGGHPRAAGFEE